MATKTTSTTKTTTNTDEPPIGAADANSIGGFFISEVPQFRNDNRPAADGSDGGDGSGGPRDPVVGSGREAAHSLLPPVTLSFVAGRHPFRFLARISIVEVAPMAFAAIPLSLRHIGTGWNLLASKPERGAPIAGFAETLTGAGEHAVRWASDYLAL